MRIYVLLAAWLAFCGAVGYGIGRLLDHILEGG